MAHGLMKVCEDSHLLDERQIERRLSRLLMEASFSSDPTSVMMKRLMAMVTDMGMSLKPTVAGAFRAIITLDGTLSSVNPTFSLSAASQSYSGQINKGQLIKERISKVKGQLEDYVPKLLELPLLKDNRIMIVREDQHSLQDMVSMMSVSMFIVICMVVMLTSFSFKENWCDLYWLLYR